MIPAFFPKRPDSTKLFIEESLELLLGMLESVWELFSWLNPVNLGLFDMVYSPEQGDFYYIIENFGRVCEIFGFVAL